MLSTNTQSVTHAPTIPPVMPVYNRADIVFERGVGPWLYDKKGKKYLDFVAGVAVNALGHCHPAMIAALNQQASTLWHVSNLFAAPWQENFAQKLIDHSFADTVFFTNSGVEAWECGLKLVRRYFHSIGQPERYRVITFDGAFHGRTMAAISASPQEKLITGFAPLLDGFDVVPWNDLAAVTAAIGPHTAAIHLEPVQGEGGIRPASPAFLQALRALADQHGLLLYMDEIQCGMGRTGKLFAYEWAGVMPDVMCLAKGIGGGFPLGACLATAEAAKGMTAGAHGSTYGGNPLAMAVGAAVFDVLTAPGFLDQVQQTATDLMAGLQGLVAAYPKIFAEARGAGLLLGLRCVQGISNLEMIAALRANGLLAAPAGDNVVRLLPPLIIGKDETKIALDILATTAQQVAS